MSIQGLGSGFPGVGLEKVPDFVTQDSNNPSGGDQIQHQAAPGTSQDSNVVEEFRDLIQDLFHSSGGQDSQSFGNGISPRGTMGNTVTSGNPQSPSSSGQAASSSVGTTAPPSDGDGKMPQPTDTRPPGDTRSADQIVADNPTLKNLGNQEHVMDNLKKQCGDWTDPKLTPDQRADAAYRASEVLNYIKSENASDGTARSSKVTDDGRVDGFTKDGQARHGTEAGALKDFGEKGYGALSSTHSLDKTSDKYVNKDGTTKSNAQVIGSDILGGVQKVFGVFGNIASFVGGLHIPLISQIADGAAVADAAVSGAAGVGKAALDGGDVKQAAIDMGVGIAGAGASAIAPGAGKVVTGVVDVAGRAAKEGAKKAAEQGASSITGSSSGSSDS